MVRITEDLLRKRAEHNDGELSSLEEITLHQFNIDRIEKLDMYCRNLRILFLQHNLIEKIENLNLLRSLEYLNLGINSIRRVENLQNNEELSKLDLIVNFVDDLLSVESLRPNHRLKELHLTGNPCCEYPDYRLFVIGTLPQLDILDGQPVLREEKIRAQRSLSAIRAKIVPVQEETIQRHNEEMLEREANPTYDEDGRRLYGNDPISRRLAAAELEASGEDEREDEVCPSSTDRVRRTPEEEIQKHGHVMQKNEGKWKFVFLDESEQYVLDIAVGRYCLTAQIEIDVQPSYIIVDIRKKRLCLRFEHRVSPDKIIAERSETTGHLKLVVPKATEILDIRRELDPLDDF